MTTMLHQQITKSMNKIANLQAKAGALYVAGKIDESVKIMEKAGQLESNLKAYFKLLDETKAA